MHDALQTCMDALQPRIASVSIADTRQVAQAHYLQEFPISFSKFLQTLQERTEDEYNRWLHVNAPYDLDTPTAIESMSDEVQAAHGDMMHAIRKATEDIIGSNYVNFNSETRALAKKYYRSHFNEDLAEFTTLVRQELVKRQPTRKGIKRNHRSFDSGSGKDPT